MMNRREGVQQKMLFVTLESLMPEQHFLRDLDRLVDFDFVYDKVTRCIPIRDGPPSTPLSSLK